MQEWQFMMPSQEYMTGQMRLESSYPVNDLVVARADISIISVASPHNPGVLNQFTTMQLFSWDVLDVIGKVTINYLEGLPLGLVDIRSSEIDEFISSSLYGDVANPNSKLVETTFLQEYMIRVSNSLSAIVTHPNFVARYGDLLDHHFLELTAFYHNPGSIKYRLSAEYVK